MFDPDGEGFHAFIEYFTANRSQPCPEATAWGRLCPDDYWSDEVTHAPHEYAYFALLEFSDVIGPKFRDIILTRLADSPLWSVHAWGTLDLAPDEYDLLREGVPEAYRERMDGRPGGLGNLQRRFRLAQEAATLAAR